MYDPSRSDRQNAELLQEKKQEKTAGNSIHTTRRAFLARLSATAATASEVGLLAETLGAQETDPQERQRAQGSFLIRQRAAIRERQIPIPVQVTNGDEQRYRSLIGNYSKGLPHNVIGEVDGTAYDQLLQAANEGTANAFENVPLGGTVKLANPMAGLAFDLEGADSHQLAIEPPPAVASQARADDMVELYWMALCRDVNFADYGTNRTAQAATVELSALKAFRGPKVNGRVTPETLFRGFTTEELTGPYVSQLLLRPFNYGQITMTGQISTYLAGIDYLKDQTTWLAARNGQGPFGKNQIDPQPRYIRNGRDLAAYVHTDQAFQAFYNAGIWLFTNSAPPNLGNPYSRLTRQSSFATFGAPHFLCLLAEAASRALKAVWYAKWFVHRTLRPEDFGGLVHMTKSEYVHYPLHPDVLNSHAIEETFHKYGSFFHTQAYPEGCPQHPSYAQGHGAIAGACATILKVAFNGEIQFNTIGEGDTVTASADGLSLVPYLASDGNKLTVNGEVNKLASNIGLGRNFAGVHWRSDYSGGLKFGEVVALSVLNDQRGCYGEDFSGFVIRNFDGNPLIV